MNRRNILKSTSALVTASTVGLAGCIGGDGGESGGGNSSCEVPTGDLKDHFPDSSDYTLQDGQMRVIEESSTEGQEREASAFYNGPNGEMIFQIVEYSSETIAAEETNTVEEQGSRNDFSVGYIQTGAYIISAIGNNESSVKNILKATLLSDGCVDDNVEFA